MAQVSLALVRHQGPMLKAMGNIFYHSVIPQKKGQKYNASEEKLEIEMRLPCDELVDQYCDWLGVERNAEIPPHFFCQWAIPYAVELGKKLPYALHKVLNQGVLIRQYNPLMRGSHIVMNVRIKSIEEQENKDKVVFAFDMHGLKGEKLLYCEITSVVVKKSANKVASKNTFELPDKKHLQGSWQANSQDGLNFALLTGDFNPIHLNSMLAKAMGLSGKILHGFASFAKTYELLKAHKVDFSQIQMSFLRPVKLPSILDVYCVQSQADDSDEIQVVDAASQKLCLIGKIN